MMDKKMELFKAGRELFYSKGFKDTSVSDITKSAAVAVGTFYNYYPSKEKLFLEIYILENETTKKNITDSLNLELSPESIIKDFLAQSFKATNSNKILSEWYNRDTFSELEQYYQEDERKNDYFLRYFSIELFKKWKAEGKVRDDIDNEIILGIFDSLLCLDTHKEEIGVRQFPQMIELLIEFIMKGLSVSETDRR